METKQMRMIINPDIAHPDADLSKIPAFSDGTPENTIYWDSLSETRIFELAQYAMELLGTYTAEQAGSNLAAEIYGVLEDTYPEAIEKFEELNSDS